MGKLTPIFNGEKWEVEQIIPNATITPYPQYGEGTRPNTLRITPNEGYVLHDKGADMTDINPETGEEFVVMLRYARSTKQCGATYDFAPMQMTAEGIPVTAYGNREFFTLTESVVPENSIYGGTVTPPVEVASVEEETENA